MKINMKTSDLKVIFDSCKNFVKPRSGKLFLEKVKLIFEDEICTAYAVDGIKIITLKAPCEVEEKGDIIVPILKLPKIDNVIIYDDGDDVIFDFVTEKQIIKKETEYFIDPEKLLQCDKYNFTIRFNPIELGKALNSFKSDEVVKLHFVDPLHGCHIEGKNKKAIVLPIKIKGE